MTASTALEKIEEMLNYDVMQCISFSKQYSPETSQNRVVKMFLEMKARDLRIIRLAVEGLKGIASFGEGEVVCGGFDEPGSAQDARDTLESIAKEIEGK